MEILVVDDEFVCSDLVKEILEDRGHSVITATNGLEALEILRNGSCRMVISDWEMPVMNGLELCRAVRTEDLQRYVYIVLLTSRTNTDNLVKGLSAGADDFISKPFEPEELTVKVNVGLRVLALETRNLAIFALARLAESRDNETGRHLERVRAYSRILAKELAQDDKYKDIVTNSFIALLYQTSPLHDIGKVAIPDYVLLKPDRLSDGEFEVIKTHCIRGAETMESALEQYPEAGFLRMARDIAKWHHERFDGTGYPDGLKGDEIPLSAKIFTVADVYDALVSRRIYKEPFTHVVACNIIMSERGTQFDPDIVDAFSRCQLLFQSVQNNMQKATPDTTCV